MMKGSRRKNGKSKMTKKFNSTQEKNVISLLLHNCRVTDIGKHHLQDFFTRFKGKDF